MPEITDFAVEANQFQLRIDCSLSGGAATVGCHWVDPESGRFLRESPWVQSDAQGKAHFEFEVPIAPGRYRFYVSPREEGKDWAYLKGGQFLSIDALVSETGIAVERQQLTTTGQLRRERWPGTIREILVGPFQSVWQNRHLMQSMVRRDIVARYRGSFADAFWALLNPLLLMLTYYFVFGVFLKTRFPGDPTQSGFVLFFLAGMLPWLAMNESLARAPTSALEHRNLITKVIFSGRGFADQSHAGGHGYRVYGDGDFSGFFAGDSGGDSSDGALAAGAADPAISVYGGPLLSARGDWRLCPGPGVCDGAAVDDVVFFDADLLSG